MPLKTPFYGAQTTMYCCLEPSIEKFSGQYFSDCQLKQNPNPQVTAENASKLWEVSENLIK